MIDSHNTILTWSFGAATLLFASATLALFLHSQQLTQTVSERTATSDAYAARISELEQTINERDRTLETLRSEIAQSAPEPATPSRFELLPLDDGTTLVGSILTELPFSLRNATGSILHTCNDPAYVVSRGQRPICLAETSVLMRFENELTRLNTFPYTEIGDEIALSTITFNQGTGAATTSDQTSARLVVSMNQLDCLWVDGMCLSSDRAVTIVAVPARTTTPIDFAPYLYHPSRVHWNSLGTKAVYMTPCPAGCPDPLVIGLNIDAGTSTTLLTRESYGDLFFDTVEWVDDDTFRVLDESRPPLSIDF